VVVAREPGAVAPGLSGSGSGADDRRQLVAYVVADATDAAGEMPGEWERVFDTAYAGAEEPADAGLHLAGWTSSYTGEPQRLGAMREWVDSTVARILALRPRRVLEIGCGTGLLLSRIAPHCERYCATDISAAALAYVDRRVLPALPATVDVTLLRGAAADIGPGIRDGGDIGDDGFDVVVLNSVVQYFPDVSYLRDVVASVLCRVAPGGAVFLGDLRSLPLLEAFHTEVALAAADDTTTLDRLRHAVLRGVGGEQELAVDPELFPALARELPRVCRVEVALRRGRHHNELTRYRYDATLHVGDPVGDPDGDRDDDDGDRDPGGASAPLDWDRDAVSLAGLHRALAASGPAALTVGNVPNARLEPVNRLRGAMLAAPGGTTVAELRRIAAVEGPDGSGLHDAGPRRGAAPRADAGSRAAVEPEDWWRLGAEAGYAVDVAWEPGRADGRYRVTLRRGPAPGRSPRAARSHPPHRPVDGPAPRQHADNRALHRYANSPALHRLGRRLTREARDILRDRLPEYMIPAAVVALPELPTDPNGKVDRRALPPVLLDAPDERDADVPPRTPGEERLAELWAEILGVASVGVTRSFFDLGGDSILSIRLVNRARRTGAALTPQDVFRYKTVAELAAVIAERGAADVDRRPGGTAGVDPAAVAVARARHPDAEDVYPLSGAQEHMLHRLRHTRESGLYVIHHVFRVSGERFDPDTWERAWRATIRTFPALRTSFEWADGAEPVQVVHRDPPFTVDRHDWRGLRTEEQNERLRAYIDERRARGFDLRRAPHTHLALFRVADREYLYLHLFDLALQDGWSYHAIMRRLFHSYAAIAGGREPAPVEPSAAYRDFCAWQRCRDLTGAERFWRAELGGLGLPVPALALPVARRRPARARPYAHEQLLVPDETTGALLALARRHDLTPYTLLLGAWAVLLGRETGSDDVVFGSIFSGRGAALDGIDTGVGQFFGLLPVRVRVAAEARLMPWLAGVQDRVSEIGRHEHTPVGALHDWLGVPRDAALFDSYLVNETFPELESTFDRYDGVGAEPVEFVHQTEHALRVELIIMGGHLAVNMNHYDGYFAPGSVTRWLHAYGALLADLVRRPEATVADLVAGGSAG
jgi:SAM-dependent methyltransferase